VHAADYFQAAQERATQATILHRNEQYSLAMYVSGVAAECMLRAFHQADAEFDERHDITQLFKNCDFERLGDAAHRRLHGPVNTVRMLWQNRYRFFSEQRLRSRVKALGQHQRGVPRMQTF
jgi:hypothetical protein